MPKRIEALVTPELMKWARERARLSLDQAAKKLDRPLEEIEQWESGVIRPSIAQARNAEKVYHIPLATFYLPEPPKGFSVQDLRDFRTLPNGKKTEFSLDLTLLLEETAYRQEWMRDQVIAEGGKVLAFVGSADLASFPSHVAQIILDTLDITPQEQMDCQDRYQALKLWILNAEAAGIHVFRRTDIQVEEARGFVLSDKHAPFIFVNSDDSVAAQLFTLVHELAHLWINISEVTNLGGYRHLDSESQKIEIFCNQVASIALMNPAVFDQLWKQQHDSDSLEKKISNLSGKIKVSHEAVARRLLEKGIIDNTRYIELRSLFNSHWLEYQKKQKARFKASEGGPNPHRMTVIRHGASFTKIVLNAYFNDKITGSEASSLLGNKKIDRFSSVAEFAGLKLPALKH
jgi:Zn-dependent peptidase ImmA (M78 family)